LFISLKEIIKIKANAIKKSKILIYTTGAINASEITTEKTQNEMKKSFRKLQ
jgi:hypothetical protein